MRNADGRDAATRGQGVDGWWYNGMIQRKKSYGFERGEISKNHVGTSSYIANVFVCGYI